MAAVAGAHGNVRPGTVTANRRGCYAEELPGPSVRTPNSTGSVASFA